MAENKLKLMLENNELDDLITNKESSQKLCELKTSEEVLDLLKKYDYNEAKEVFEQELLEILQISLNEEKLTSVTGGRTSHSQQLAALLGVVSLTGAINIPTEAANTKTPISAVKKETIEKKHGKNSKWMEAPREDKLAKALAGIVGVGGVVGVGSLLLYGGRKLLGSSDHDTAGTRKVEQLVKELIVQPSQSYKTLLAGISQDDLENYAISQFENWSKAMSPHYDRTSHKFTNTKAWNENFERLLKIRWAVWLLSVKLNLLTDEELKTLSGGRAIKCLTTSAGSVKMEDYQERKPMPRTYGVNSIGVGSFWKNENQTPPIGWVIYSLLEVPYCLDAVMRKSKKTVLQITDLSKKYFGKHDSPTEEYWRNLGASRRTQDEENGTGNVPQGDEKPPRVLIGNSNLAEIAELKAPGEQWEGSLETVNNIVVSLIQNPIQNYDKLVAGISRDDLMKFALEGLKLWCENTKEHYDERLKSITDAEAWNENFGLLMKVRWAVWLLCLKDEKINAEDLQNHVQGRTYAKGKHAKPFGTSPVWTERCSDKDTSPLPHTVEAVAPIWPSPAQSSYGNVAWAYCSTTDALREEKKLQTYGEFDRQLGEILTQDMDCWWETVTEPGKIPMGQKIGT